jgi:8-oxo-dGTP pyrophosphatase MutT (NUDIX family)
LPGGSSGKETHAPGAEVSPGMMRRDIRYQAAILQDHHVLLLRVVERDGCTFWLPPGGGREGDESAEACVCREVLEETTLIVGVERFLFAEPELSPGTYDSRHTYLCRVQANTARPGVEPETDTPDHASIREVAWFDLRAPTGWPALLVEDPFTHPWLERLRAALGYARSIPRHRSDTDEPR